MPVRHDLDVWLREYIEAAGLGAEDKKAPLLRSAEQKRRRSTACYQAHSIRQMLKRYLINAGLPEIFSPHSFRVAVVTDLLSRTFRSKMFSI